MNSVGRAKAAAFWQPTSQKCRQCKVSMNNRRDPTGGRRARRRWMAQSRPTSAQRSRGYLGL